MKKINPFFAVFYIAILVAFYQVSLVSQKLNHYGVENNLTSTMGFGMDLQQKVEDIKISLRAAGLEEKTEKSIEKPSDITVFNAASTHAASNASSNTLGNGVNAAINTETQDIIAKKCSEKCTILTIGDSVMGDVYYSLNRQLKKYHPDWKIIDAHKVSSGLSKDTYYNWPKVAQKLVAEIKPDYVLILIGMNDAQGIVDENRTAQFNTELWSEVYRKRTQQIYTIISAKSEAVWIQLPNVKAEGFEKRLSSVRKIHEEVSQKNYFSVKKIIGDSHDSGFAKYRQNDGIHLNALGADMIAEHIYKETMN